MMTVLHQDCWWTMPALAQPPDSTHALAIISVVLVLYALFYWRRHAVGAHPVPPGVPLCPGAIPLLGNIVAVVKHRDRLCDWLAETTEAFGGRTWAFTLPLLPTYFVCSNPTNLEYVLKQRMDNFVKGRPMVRKLGPVLGHGIFASDGARWKAHRKLASNIFSVRSFKEHVAVTFAQRLDSLMVQLDAAADSGEVIDLMDLLYRYTMDVFACVGFGVELGCLSDGEQSQEAAAFSRAFDASIKTCNLRWWLPMWPVIEALNGRGRKLRRDVQTIRRFAAKLIQARREGMATQQDGLQQYAHACGGGTGSPDLLALFMSSPGSDGGPLSDEELTDHVINFIIAGRDTTAQAIAWCISEVITHPQVEEAVLRETCAMLPTHGPGDAGGVGVSAMAADAGLGAVAAEDVKPAIDAIPASALTDAARFSKLEYEQLQRFKYTHAVFLESLRMWPSVPLDLKFPLEPDVLPDGTAVPAGGLLLYAPYVNGRSKIIWGEDANVFRPERWLEMSTLPSPYKYLSFNAGPRLCLGKTLAELEGVYVLAGLLQRYKLRLAPGKGNEVTYVLSTTLAMKNGLKVLVERRREE